MTGWLGITLGDITGVGPEITLKALASRPPFDTRFLIIGDAHHLRELNQNLGLNLKLLDYSPGATTGTYFVYNPLTNSLPAGLPAGHSAAANAAVSWLGEAARRCLAGELDGMVTAPVSKEAIIRAGHAFVGQTEFLSELARTERTAMMLLGRDDRGRWLRVVLVTTHLPIRQVADHITAEKVILAIERAADSCRLLGLKRGRIGVCGLNPHAGEGGKMGDEEIRIIGPAVTLIRERQLDVHGPLAADTLFYRAFKGDFDVVVAMYHDQGLGPLKMIGFEHGVNWTLGLPFIRTSPDHGTAYDIAGKGMADPSSMQAAIDLACQLARTR